MTNYFCVNAPTGSGKTHAAIDWAAEQAHRGQKILIAQPTIRLIDETERACRSRHPGVKIQASHGDGSVSRIIEHSKSAKPFSGEILLISHAALLLTCGLHFENAGQWNLIIDETIDPDWNEAISLAEHTALVSELYGTEIQGSDYLRILPNNSANLTKIVENKREDAIYAFLRDLASRVSSPHWEVRVETNSWNRFIDGKQDKFVAHGILAPSIFEKLQSVTMMSAAFDATMLSQVWGTNFGVKFTEHRGITAQLRFRHHENGKRLCIAYGSSEPWSKKSMGKVSEAGKSNLDIMAAGALQAIGDEPFLWQGNRNVPDDYFSANFKTTSDIRIPGVASGLNEYSHINNCVILSARNPLPAHFRFLDELGIDPDETRTAIARTAAYQAISRTSLRNPSAKEPVFAVVPDLSSAQWLSTLYPGCQVMPLASVGSMVAGRKVGRPRLHASDAERMRKARAEARVKLSGMIEQLDELNQSDAARFEGAIYQSRTDTKGMPVEKLHEDGLFEFLKIMFERDIQAKADAMLWSPSIYDPSLSEETNRGYKNLLGTQNIVLDIEHGEMSPEDFASVFPNWRMLAVNSASHTTAEPRFRIFVETDEMMSREVFEAVCKEILRKLKKSGFGNSKEVAARKGRLKPHGIDPSKMNPTALFLLPSQLSGEPGAQFLKEFSENRVPMNVRATIGATVAHAVAKPVETSREKPQPNPVASDAVQALAALLGEDAGKAAEKVERAVDAWRSSERGKQHGALYRLATQLKAAGLPYHEARMILEAEAGNAFNPRERLSEITDLMKKYKR